MNLILVLLLGTLAKLKMLQVNSFVFSGETFFDRHSQKKFFFAVPFSFNSVMDYENGKMTCVFPNRLSDTGNLKAVNEGVADLEKSRFADLFEIQKDQKGVEKVIVNLSNPKYKVTLVRKYDNKTFNSI